MLNEAWNNAFFVETLPHFGFHTFSIMNSTYPSTIWDKSSASYARALAKYSVSAYPIAPWQNIFSVVTKDRCGMIAPPPHKKKLQGNF